MVRLLSPAACTATAACAASSLLAVGASFVLGYGLARAFGGKATECRGHIRCAASLSRHRFTALANHLRSAYPVAAQWQVRRAAVEIERLQRSWRVGAL
jgi:hypothetical protein